MSRDMGINLIANTSQFKSDMSAVNRSMRTVKTEMEAARNETDEYGNKIQDNETKVQSLTKQMDNHRERVSLLEKAHADSAEQTGENSKETQELEARLNKANSEMNKTEGQLKQTQAEMEELESATEDAGMSFEEFDQKFRDVGGTMRNVGGTIAGVSGVALAGLVKPMRDAAEVAIDFESQMSSVESISGATGSELEALEDQAKELGQTTKYSASESAEGMEMLARAGFDTSEIISSMPGLLDLAASSNMDLGRAADITSNIISGFGMEAEEAGRVSDVLAAGAASANLDVEGLGNSMATVAPIAEGLGIGFEDLAAATGIMADSGIFLMPLMQAIA
ncbi:myosin heavy subunit [Virgibacillus natechei]|uniref:Myosin heavy subunit n=1 Tax=Virgibacillus natechei TaxID=1216297 RepID=A0ABS4IAS7_9BACI|nr:phage tail tape measure protein [Virgibacillus natechei]MBP1967973.1 myosin heavy subunit [Virgibacillus natechei]UZD14740.1 phage tail tape measure protein [Virgibacillus natechei]